MYSLKTRRYQGRKKGKIVEESRMKELSAGGKQSWITKAKPVAYGFWHA